MARNRLHVVLYEPEIPQNTGAIARSCVAVGAKMWLVRPLGFRVDDRHMRRAGLDYWEHLDWAVTDNWTALLGQLRTQRLWLFSKHASRGYCDVAFQAGDALVFGPETKGLPRSLLAEREQFALRIPIRPEVRSLNVANAASVAMFEAIRQIGFE